GPDLEQRALNLNHHSVRVSTSLDTNGRKGDADLRRAALSFRLQCLRERGCAAAAPGGTRLVGVRRPAAEMDEAKAFRDAAVGVGLRGEGGGDARRLFAGQRR